MALRFGWMVCSSIGLSIRRLVDSMLPWEHFFIYRVISYLL